MKTNIKKIMTGASLGLVLLASGCGKKPSSQLEDYVGSPATKENSVIEGEVTESPSEYLVRYERELNSLKAMNEVAKQYSDLIGKVEDELIRRKNERELNKQYQKQADSVIDEMVTW